MESLFRESVRDYVLNLTCRAGICCLATVFQATQFSMGSFWIHDLC